MEWDSFDVESAFGNLSITAAPAASSEQRGQIAHAPKLRYSWRPPGRLGRQLPPEFKLELDCHIAGGLRRFTPVGGAESFVHRAFAAGLAILDQERHLSAEHRFSYRLMHQVFQLVRRMREHLDGTFASVRSLEVPKQVRGGNFTRTILPPDVGFDAQGRGHQWSTTELVRCGIEAAEQDGVERADEATAITFGLLAAARRRPLYLRAGESRPLMRLALFDSEALANPSSGMVEVVTERLAKLVWTHLGDDVTRFDRWFFPGNGNLAKALVGGPRSAGGKLSIDQVRQSLLALGWHAYQYVADSHQMFFFWFQRSMPDALSSDEFRLYGQMYRPQECFGGIPLLLLIERLEMIHPILTAIWEQPANEYLVGVLHRMLSFYAAMAPMRREVDRLLKRKDSAGCEVTNRDWTHHGAPDETSSIFDSVAAAIAASRKLKCDRCSEWKAFVESRVPPSPVDEVVLELSCAGGHTTARLSLTQEDFRRIASPVLNPAADN